MAPPLQPSEHPGGTGFPDLARHSAALDAADPPSPQKALPCPTARRAQSKTPAEAIRTTPATAGGSAQCLSQCAAPERALIILWFSAWLGVAARCRSAAISVAAPGRCRVVTDAPSPAGPHCLQIRPIPTPSDSRHHPRLGPRPSPAASATPNRTPPGPSQRRLPVTATPTMADSQREIVYLKTNVQPPRSSNRTETAAIARPAADRHGPACTLHPARPAVPRRSNAPTRLCRQIASG